MTTALSDPQPWRNPRYTGDRTFDPRPQTRPMERTYFYYFGPGANDTLRTLVYHQDGRDLPDDATFASWIAAARKGAGGHQGTADIDNVEWRGPCFLAFFVDLPNWRYIEDGKKINKSLYFAEDKTTKHHGNFSFFNARSHDISLDGSSRELLVVENHHLKAPETGYARYEPRKEGDPDDHYKFDIYLGQPIEGSSGKKMWFVLDPGGKNMGPP